MLSVELDYRVGDPVQSFGLLPNQPKYKPKLMYTSTCFCLLSIFGQKQNKFFFFLSTTHLSPCYVMFYVRLILKLRC